MAAAQVIVWDRGRPARTRRRRGGFQAATFPFIFALRAHCGRDARGPSQSLESSLVFQQVASLSDQLQPGVAS